MDTLQPAGIWRAKAAMERIWRLPAMSPPATWPGAPA